MLDEFKDKQPLAYDIMKKEIFNNHLSHAYLIDENNYENSFDMIMAFVKEIVCSNLSDDVKKNICRRIDDGNYPEIMVISPDGMLIKKKQILDLQHEFAMSAFEGNRRIYIIRDADKMKTETANSMLKFLEEPENGIIAILMTNNFNSVLSTIISRCQIIRLNNDINATIKFDDLDEIVINFIKKLEEDGINTIIFEQDILFNKLSIKDRDTFIKFFDKMIDMYYDIMKISSGNLNINFNLYLDILTDISNKNNELDILKKISYISYVKDAIKYNVNINLLIDSLIINVGGNL